MAEHKSAKAEGLMYKGHPLRRVDNLIYYGTMAEKYIIMMQILDTKKEQDLDVATKVSVQLQLTDPDLKSLCISSFCISSFCILSFCISSSAGPFSMFTRTVRSF